MLSTKIRTTIIAVITTSSFAGASLVPAVSQARAKKPGTTVTCPDITGGGVGQPGDILTVEWNVILPNGQWGTEKEKKICGSDGKWHKVVDLVVTGGTLPEAPTSAPEPGSMPPTRLAPRTPAGTLG
jgi:hypothetical protein